MLTAVVPGIVLVFAVWAVVASGGYSGAPSRSTFWNSWESIGARDVWALALLGVGVGMLLRPLQFPFTQFLEGYWGSTRPGAWASAFCRRGNRRRYEQLAGLSVSAPMQPDVFRTELSSAVAAFDVFRVRRLWRERDGMVLDMTELRSYARLVRGEEADRELAAYPRDPDRVLPTRLGNALRRGEDGAGAPYGLTGLDVVPRILGARQPAAIQPLIEARTQMDAAITLCLALGVADLASLIAYWDDGWWIALTVAGYFATWLAYRGAVDSAHEFSLSLEVLVDLNRGALYEGLGVRAPSTSDEERELNESISSVLGPRVFEPGIRYSRVRA